MVKISMSLSNRLFLFIIKNSTILDEIEVRFTIFNPEFNFKSKSMHILFKYSNDVLLLPTIE